VDPYLQYEIGYKVDVWMVGCVIYTLAFFTHPFVDSNAVGIAGGVYRFPKYPEETQYQVSDKIKDLIRNLLTPDPTYRPSVDEVIALLNGWHTMSSIPLNVRHN
jgi:AP2-associated kinase